MNLIFAPKKLTTHVMKESLFWEKRGKSDIFYRKKFVMSLIRIIFAFENEREVASFGFVFSECLRYAFALASLLRLETRCIQKGRKQTSTIPIRFVG